MGCDFVSEMLHSNASYAKAVEFWSAQFGALARRLRRDQRRRGRKTPARSDIAGNRQRWAWNVATISSLCTMGFPLSQGTVKIIILSSQQKLSDKNVTISKKKFFFFCEIMHGSVMSRAVRTVMAFIS